MERWHAQATVSRVAKMSVSRWHVVFIFSALHTGHFCSSCLHSRPSSSLAMAEAPPKIRIVRLPLSCKCALHRKK